MTTMIRTADLLDGEGARAIHADLVCYAPRRERRRVGTDGRRGGSQSASVDHWNDALERSIGLVQIHSAVQKEALTELFTESNNRESARSERLAEADGVVPLPVWIVLIASGLMILVYVSFFADPRERLISQVMMSGSVAVIVISGLLLVAFFASPFADRPGGLEPTAMEDTLRIEVAAAPNEVAAVRAGRRAARAFAELS